MAGVIIGNPDVYDPDNDDYFEPGFDTGLKTMLFPRKNGAQSTKDWNRPQTDPAVPAFRHVLIGQPLFDVAGHGLAMFADRAQGLDLDFPDEAEFTWLLAFSTTAAANTDTTKPMLACSNRPGGASDGSSIQIAAPNAISISGRRTATDGSTSSGVGATLTGFDLSVPKIVACQMGNTKASVWNMTDQASRPSAVGNGYASLTNRPIRNPSLKNWRLGSSFQSAGQLDGRSTLYAAAYLSGFVADTDLQLIRAKWAPYLIGECGWSAA